MTLVAAVCVLIALLGYSFGRAAWPLAVGAVVGDALMYLAIKLERHRMPIVVSALFLVVVGLVMLVDFIARQDDLAFKLPWDTPVVVSKLFIGLLLGFGGMILASVVIPTWSSPETWDEAVVQRRATVRDVLIVGGMVLGLALLVLLLVGFVALVAWIAVNFG